MSIPGERDETLEKWLRQLRPAQADGTAACLDAESAAAWVSGALSGDAPQQAQVHLADCDRCQSLVGSLVRADVGGEPAAAPERTWMRWLLPLSAAATAVVAVGVWAALPRETREPVSSAEATAQTQPAAVPESPIPREKADARSDQAFTAPAPRAVAAAPAAPARSAAPKTEELRREAPAGQLAAGTRPPASPAEASAPTAAQTLADRAAAAPASARIAQQETALFEIGTLDQSVRWRVTARQAQRSMDRGASWEAVPLGANAALTAGSAPARTVCWLVGRGGIVLLTTNGTTFARVPFPEPSDLIAVTAADARSAMVTTSDGRTFRTSDGGATWR